MFHVLKTPVYRFDLYGRYRILQTDEDNLWQCYLELVYKPKYQIWCESDFPCVQHHGIPVWFIWEAPDPVNRYSPFSIPTSVWVIEAYVQSLQLFVFGRNRVYHRRTDGRTDRHSSNVLEFCADQMSLRNIDHYFYVLQTY